jgi:hypothetical protein
LRVQHLREEHRSEDKQMNQHEEPGRAVEREAVRTTIVGGRPPGSGKELGPIPRGIEVLVKKASVDPEFKALLLEKRAAAAREISLELAPAEVLMLNAVPPAQIEAIIANTKVSEISRAAFLGRAATVMLAALGAAASGCGEPPKPVLGIPPDRIPTKGIDPEKVRKEEPKPAEAPEKVPVTDGIRPDRPPTTKGIQPDRPEPAPKQEGAADAELLKPVNPPPRPADAKTEATSNAETGDELKPVTPPPRPEGTETVTPPAPKPPDEPAVPTAGVRPDQVTRGIRPDRPQNPPAPTGIRPDRPAPKEEATEDKP